MGKVLRFVACGALVLAGGTALLLNGPVQAADPAHEVVVLKVDGIINPATSEFVNRGLDDAAADQAGLVVIELDTPGGLDTSMRAIIKHILASPVPVATFVAPAGARAASAGTFILYASHIAAMTPASNVGAASPVSIGMPGIDRSPMPSSDEPDAAQSGTDGQTSAKSPDAKPPRQASPPAGDDGDTMARKVTNDAAAYIRSLAQLRGRNVEFAEKAVRNAASMSAQEALKAGVIDVVAANLDDLLTKVDGRKIKLGSGATITLATADASVRYVEPGWRNHLLSFLANPQLALILMMVGIYGLFFELISPGVGLPGVAGLICLVLGLYAFHMLPVNWAGVGLIALGTILMIAEAFIPSFGVAGAGGVLAFVLGGIFLTDTGIPGFDLSIPFLIGVAAISAILLFIIGTMATRAHQRRVVTGREQMAGLTGVVTMVGDTMTYAHIRGESWRVHSTLPLTVGDHVQVISMQGLTLQVQRIDAHDLDAINSKDLGRKPHVL